MYRVISADFVTNYSGTQVCRHKCSKALLFFFMKHLRNCLASLQCCYLVQLDSFTANLRSLGKLPNGLATRVFDQTQIGDWIVC